MGFVLSQHEIEEIRRVISDVEFSAEALVVEFTIDPNYLRSVVPPCFVPDPEGKASVAIGWWKNRGDMASMPDTYIASVDVAVTYEGAAGTWNLAMYLSDDWGTVFGREVWGESKKRADFTLTTGSTNSASVTRNGVTIIEIDGQLNSEPAAYASEGVSFEVRGLLRGDLTGLVNDPTVITMGHKDEGGIVRTGSADLVLRGTVTDPFGDIPVTGVGNLIHATIERSSWAIRSEDVLEGVKEAYFPYILGRNFDFGVIASEAGRAGQSTLPRIEAPDAITLVQDDSRPVISSEDSDTASYLARADVPGPVHV